MQDVFLTYYHQLLAGITIHNLKAWLLSVTKHKSLNVLRDSGREVCQEDFLMAETADDAAGIGKDELVWQLLAQLTDQERLAFSLHYLDGYTYKEIAVGLAIPIGTVQTRCRLARKKLKNSLQNTTEEKETWP